MNKNLIFDAVLAVAVVVLFILHFTQKPAQVTTVESGAAVQAELPIAYLNLDSLLVNYQFAIDANDRLMSKQEDARVKLSTRARAFQNEAAEFQRKLDNNAFLSRERAESEYARIQSKEQELQQMEAQLSQDLMVETQEINLQLADTLSAFLEVFNADGRYKMIISNTGKDNVLMADKAMDITDEIIDALNARYSK